MKKPILIFAIIAIVAGFALIGCQSTGKRVENAQENVQDAEHQVIVAQQDLDEATKDSINEYKKVTQEKIIAQEKSIAEFKARMANDKKENRAKYEKKLAEIEQQNTDLKKRLDDFKADKKEQWEKFKTELNNELDEIGKSIKNLPVKSIH